VAVRHKGSADSVQEYEQFSAKESHEETFMCGGEYLPLSVWETRGFNPKFIEERSLPEDILEDRVLGRVYRVRITNKVCKSA
jgi:hypothetical protein